MVLVLCQSVLEAGMTNTRERPKPDSDPGTRGSCLSPRREQERKDLSVPEQQRTCSSKPKAYPPEFWRQHIPGQHWALWASQLCTAPNSTELISPNLNQMATVPAACSDLVFINDYNCTIRLLKFTVMNDITFAHRTNWLLFNSFPFSIPFGKFLVVCLESHN